VKHQQQRARLFGTSSTGVLFVVLYAMFTSVTTQGASDQVSTPAAVSEEVEEICSRLASSPGDTHAREMLKNVISRMTNTDEQAHIAVIYTLGCMYVGRDHAASSTKRLLERNYASNPYLKYLGPEYNSIPCKKCGGEGYIIARGIRKYYRRQCLFCKGSGRESSEESVKRTYLALLNQVANANPFTDPENHAILPPEKHRTKRQAAAEAIADLKIVRPLCGDSLPPLWIDQGTTLNQRTLEIMTARMESLGPPGPYSVFTAVERLCNLREPVDIGMTIVTRVGALFDGAQLRRGVRDRYVKRMNSLEGSDVRNWRSVMSTCCDSELSRPLVACMLAAFDPLYENEVYLRERGRKCMARLRSMTKRGRRVTYAIMPGLGAQRADYMFHLAVTDVFFADDDFQEELFLNALSDMFPHAFGH